MVLTDRQRNELHAGIYEYLKSREGDAFQQAAAALAQADPAAAAAVAESASAASSTSVAAVTRGTTLLEKKWTAIPRLQKKVLELERAAAHNIKIHGHRMGGAAADGNDGGTAATTSMRRMLPRFPATHTLQGHSAVVLTVQVHPVFTVVVSGSEDGTIKVRPTFLFHHVVPVAFSGWWRLLSLVRFRTNCYQEPIETNHSASLDCILDPFLYPHTGLGSRKWRIFAYPQGAYQLSHQFGFQSYWCLFGIEFYRFEHEIVGFFDLHLHPDSARARSYHFGN